MPLALGTDTAGSGRVPAMLNNIVGLKPSLGLISNAGLVPACRTLDCISVFSLTVDDAMTALAAMAGADGADPFSRDRPLGTLSAFPEKLRLGVPRNGQLIFFGDRAAEKAYGEALERWTSLGATLVEFDLEPFYETARLLYEGPWVAERYLVIRDLLASSPDSIHPVTREITAPGARLTAADTFASLYRLQALRRTAERIFADFDAMVLPTAPTAYSTAQVLANPIELNSRLGTYTNFVNLLDLCGLALPAAMRADGIPFGITLLAPAGRDAQLASIGRVFHADTKLKMGSKGLTQPAARCVAGGEQAATKSPSPWSARISPAWRSTANCRSLGGRLLEATTTAPDYKLYALDTTPPKPGMLRVDAGAGQFDQAGAVGVVGGSVRQIRRRDPAAARDRHGTAGGWTRREGICGRARRDRWRARYFIVRRLARVHGGEGGSVSPHAVSRRRGCGVSNHARADAGIHRRPRSAAHPASTALRHAERG